MNEHIVNKLNFFLKTKKIPHIIFYGSSGSGKKTLMYEFIYKIYENDKQKIKSNVMFVNCSHGKGIKFIRDELKFFAKSNVQFNSGILFKSIVLLNADFLTIDAQSALRRCIELFSNYTRFFIIVENKHKLLNPIVSRFCEIHVPEYVENGKTINLHQQKIKKVFGEHEYDYKYIHDSFVSLKKNNEQIHWLKIIDDFYENGISCLDIIRFIENTDWWSEEEMNEIRFCFHNKKIEYRNEKILMFDIFLHSLKQNNENVKI